MADAARCFLSHQPHLSDVVDVLGIAAGLPFERLKFDQGEGTHVWVEGVHAEGHRDIPAMATIYLNGPLLDGSTNHHCTFHFEGDSHDGRTILAASTPFWIAVLRKLVDVFGGAVESNDCGGPNGPDYASLGIDNVLWRASDGDAWEQKVAAIAAVTPCTRADLDAVRQKAGYPERGYENLKVVTIETVEEEVTIRSR